MKKDKDLQGLQSFLEQRATKTKSAIPFLKGMAVGFGRGFLSAISGHGIYNFFKRLSKSEDSTLHTARKWHFVVFLGLASLVVPPLAVAGLILLSVGGGGSYGLNKGKEAYKSAKVNLIADLKTSVPEIINVLSSKGLHTNAILNTKLSELPKFIDSSDTKLLKDLTTLTKGLNPESTVQDAIYSLQKTSTTNLNNNFNPQQSQVNFNNLNTQSHIYKVSQPPQYNVPGSYVKGSSQGPGH